MYYCVMNYSRSYRVKISFYDMSHNTVGQDFEQGVLGDSSVPCGISCVTWWYLLADELVWNVQDSCIYISVTLLEMAGRLVPAGVEHLCLASPGLIVTISLGQYL